MKRPNRFHVLAIVVSIALSLILTLSRMSIACIQSQTPPSATLPVGNSESELSVLLHELEAIRDLEVDVFASRAIMGDYESTHTKDDRSVVPFLNWFTDDQQHYQLQKGLCGAATSKIHELTLHYNHHLASVTLPLKRTSPGLSRNLIFIPLESDMDRRIRCRMT